VNTVIQTGGNVTNATIEFILKPSTLASASQIVGAGAIALGCPTGLVVLCAAGITIYTYASLYKVVVLADTPCERIVAAFTSLVGGPPITGIPGDLIAALSGFVDAAVCPSTAVAAPLSTHGGKE